MGSAMLAGFCLRLALGLVAALFLIPSSQVAPRFYRVQFLIILGLAALAAVAGRHGLGWLIALMVLAFASSVIWNVEGAPGGRPLMIMTGVLLLYVTPERISFDRPGLLVLANDYTSALLLGSAVSAMLMGHSYLISPTMALTPLMRLLGALGFGLGLRMVVSVVILRLWTGQPFLASLGTESLLWLGLRWGIGFVGPLILGWMAWQSARIRSTQSATGILYVVVIFCFIGELLSQLFEQTTLAS